MNVKTENFRFNPRMIKKIERNWSLESNKQQHRKLA